MELTSQWAQALEPNVKSWVHDGYSAYPDYNPEVFSIDSDKSGILRYQRSWSQRIVPKSSEAASSPEASLTKGYQLVEAPQIFKQKMSVSKEYVTRGMYSEIKDMSSALGRAAIESINLFGAGVFINAFSTSYTGADAKPLCSTLHPRADGGLVVVATLGQIISNYIKPLKKLLLNNWGGLSCLTA